MKGYFLSGTSCHIFDADLRVDIFFEKRGKRIMGC